MEVIQSSGFNIFLETSSVRKDVVWDSVTAPGYWFGTLLEGNIAVNQSQLGERNWTSGGTAVFSSNEEIHTRHTSLHDGSVSAVFLQIEIPQGELLLGEEASGLLANNLLHRDGIFPDLAKTIAWQMLGCQLTGAARRLLITGKAMEIVAHLINSTFDGQAVGAEMHAEWSHRDIECFHAARAILLTEFADPPSVTELARRVGTNARKLGAGFNALFGMPVYSFVKTSRLETARQMLEAGETSVSHVARYVGYQPQHFATAFRRHFGISPTQIIGRRP
ncbi:helix-turn-helix transcriptional regulator [Agrobacterium fabrum]|uniref:helix-turn-helix transcriptional regulator n=1 Tax=Agrobacterium fabrum TaxID=1176649 RepID=UPI00215771AE|nr:AraC family transcriptional regulator [Agrobacterium fabrum]MCR6727791.1 AraC family transcriptional regulator [Agrobacterium fabrum]